MGKYLSTSPEVSNTYYTPAKIITEICINNKKIIIPIRESIYKILFFNNHSYEYCINSPLKYQISLYNFI